MRQYGIMVRLIAIGFVTIVCFVASMFVYRLVAERESSYVKAQSEVGATWGAAQTVVGPMLVFSLPPVNDSAVPVERYVLPRTLKVESVLIPEVRSRGIYDTVVYTETLKISGIFSGEDIGDVPATSKPTFTVSLSDARSIEEQVSLDWNGANIPFEPGPSAQIFDGAGIHARVPFSPKTIEYAFSFNIALKGIGEAKFTPVGKETEVYAASPWQTPSFTGAFLPSERSVSDDGFTATWRVSSFGRNYPQVWESTDAVSAASLVDSAFGVEFHEGVDLYLQMYRSIKYAILFIVITFTTLFLFEVLRKVRVHPIQYLLIGSALALFYLLLLSLAEQIGFLYAYLLATAMVTVLITSYGASVLKNRSHTLLLGGMLALLYGYLYFVLQLEDYALLFGALLLFALLAGVMFLTRKVDWFGFGRGEN